MILDDSYSFYTIILSTCNDPTGHIAEMNTELMILYVPSLHKPVLLSLML